MLKSIFSVALLFLVIGISNAQTKLEWKELSEFHTVMSQTFHPAEEGNFKPIRERSAEMIEKAAAWQKSAIPADYKSVKKIKKNLALLVKGTKALDKNIKSGSSDEKILTDLTALHDVFHNVVGLCMDEH